MPTKKIEEAEEVTRCPECNSGHLSFDYERGELICEECGLVLTDQMIDQGPEWRAFDVEQGEKRARTGAPMTYTIHDKGLSTTIGWKNKDSYGKSIPTRNRAQLYRLRKWQRRIRVSNATERNLAFALSELDRMASGMGLPRNVRETAAMVYRKAVNKNLIRGRSIEGVVAASLYAACRQCNVPRTLDEIANSSRVGRKEIGRTYRFMTRELKLKLMPTKPQDYVSRFCSELKLTGEVQSRAVEILKEAQDKELTSGRGPTGVAAAAIYIASILCKEHRRGPDRPHLGRLARPNPKTCPDDEERRPEGHHELLAEDRHIRRFRTGREQQQMVRENGDQNDETDRDEPTEDTPPSACLQPVLNAPVQEERRGHAQSDRDPCDRDEVDRIRDRRVHQEHRSNPESQDDDEQHSEQPSGRAERPRVVQERQERQQHGADDEQRGEQIDELDFRRGRDPGSLRRNDPGQGSRRFPRMRGTDWPPTRTTLGFPPSVSTLTSMRLAWWISIPCSITNVGAGSRPR